ncbi:MAG: pantoate--beta-alanine ligase [Pirellula sp.]|jgi:pantoate--beta-alanine ligase
MRVIHSPLEIYSLIDFERRENRRVGLVPTMGALHEGHLSLVTRAKQDCDVAVATIFVNPTQFGPNEDFSKYPRTLESDLEKLASVGCDYVFVPAADEIYRPGHSTYVDPPQVASQWEGAIRPGHFRGVTTIVMKLFMMVPAHIAFFGRKDYQQVAVIRGMVEDLNLPIRVETCDTIRESDGLAMSSRNRYLTADERQRALSLSRALNTAREMISHGERDVSTIEAAMNAVLLAAPVDKIDYAKIVHADTLEPLSQIDSPAVAIIAARLGSTRLIDNCPLL